MKGKIGTKEIIITILIVVLLGIAITGTVLFLKDSGEAAAMEVQDIDIKLPATGTDNQTESNEEQAVEEQTANPEDIEETTEEEIDEIEQEEEEQVEDTQTATPTQNVGVITEEPTPTTIEQERVISEETTLGWNNLMVGAGESNYVEKDINYNNLKYTVEYYFDGVIAEDLTETVDKNQKGKVIDTYTDKNKIGYKLDKVENLPLTISENQETNVMKVHYVRDDSQTQPTSYTVRHVVAGEEKDTKTYNGTAWINDENPTIEIEVGSLTQKTYVGYKYDSIDVEAKEGDKIASGTVITLTYVRDDTQTQPTNYTVRHVVAGEEKDTKTYNGTAWINDENPTIEIEVGSLTPKTYIGYKYDSIDTEAKEGDKVASGTIITLKYVKDKSQTNKLTYTVNHITVDGNNKETTVATTTYEENVYVLDEQKIEIKANTVKALAEDDTKIKGYELDETKIPTEKTGDKVDNGTVINFYYKVIKYPFTVEYYYNGVKEAEVTGNAPVDTTIIIEEKPKEGFTKYEWPEDTSIKPSKSENVFKVCYGKPDVEITKKAPAEVNYGEEIHYEITVTNKGYIGTNVTVTDELKGTTYKENSSTEPVNQNGNVLTWNIYIPAATKNENAEKTIEFDVTTPANSVGTVYKNIATATTTENIVSSTDEISTKVKDLTVTYDEYKEGKEGTDLNIIFIIDNSSSMNKSISEGDYTNDEAQAVAPGDKSKTRLQNAKSAIQDFIKEQSSNTMTVIKYNTKTSGEQKVIKLIGEGYSATKKDLYYEAEIGDSKVTLTNDTYGFCGYIGILNDKKYILGTDGNCYEYEEIKEPQGAQVVGTTIPGKTGAITNSELSTAVSSMSVGDLKETFGTYVSPAFDIAKNYIVQDKTNVVIVLSDGAFNDYDYSYKASTLIKNGADYIYSVAFGSDASITRLGEITNVYEKDENGNDTTVKKVYTASDSGTLLNQFNAMAEASSGKVQNKNTDNGIVTFDPASNKIKVTETCPLTAYITGTTTELFKCTDKTELGNYGIEIYSDEKTVKWNVNTFISNYPEKGDFIKNGNGQITIKYYIPNGN